MVLAVHQGHDYSHVKDLAIGSTISDVFYQDIPTYNYVLACGDLVRHRYDCIMLI